MQMSLAMSMPGLFSAIIEMTRHVHHVFCFLVMTEISRPLTFVCVYARTQSIQKQVVEYMRYKK